jgi:hypothetical protein
MVYGVGMAVANARFRGLGRLAAWMVAAALAMLPATRAAGQMDRVQTDGTDAEQRARELFDQGKAAFTRRDYAAAADAFDRAHHTRPHHSALWNAALAWDSGGEPVKAANRFAGYLEMAPVDAPDRDTALSRLKELSRKLGRLELYPEGVTHVEVDGRSVDSTTIYVSPGSHVVTARYESGAVRQVASVGAGAFLSVVLTPPTEATHVDDESDDRFRGLPPATVYAGAAVTALLGGVTVWSGLDTLDARDRFDREPTEAGLESGRKKQSRTNILFAVTAGVALLTGATALFLVDWDPEQPPRAPVSTLTCVRW